MSVRRFWAGLGLIRLRARRPVTAALVAGLFASSSLILPGAARVRRPHHARVVHHSTAVPPSVTGLASWYGIHDHSSKRTASGRAFRAEELGVAHPTLPFGTRLRMTAVETGRTVTVTVLDRTGPAVRRKGRTIDLYFGAAKELGLLSKGEALVRAVPIDEVEVAEAPGSASLPHPRRHRERANARVLKR